MGIIITFIRITNNKPLTSQSWVLVTSEEFDVTHCLYYYINNMINIIYPKLI